MVAFDAEVIDRSGMPVSIPGMSELRGEELVCIRGERPVFARLSFAWREGAACRLVGPNGAGKSSLLRLLAGLISPAAGRLIWDGNPVTEDREGHRARVSYCGHQEALKSALTVREGLTFWANLGGDSTKLDRALEVFDLTRLADTPARILSSGQKRRAALARLVIESRRIWLLDEPTVGLDAASQGALERLIADHRSSGGIVVAATHVPIELPEAISLDMADFAPRKRRAEA